MKNPTRVKYNEYLAQLGELNGVEDVTKKFAVSTPIEQKLEEKIQDNSAFLQRVNIVPVDQQQGEKLGLGVSGTIAGTTDTSTTDRATQDITNLDDIGYLCTQTNFDTHATYSKLDMWAKFKDFQLRMRDANIKRVALDRQLIGWNGTSRAATSDRVTNPLLQDVNIGWLQKLRDAAPARVLTEVVALSGQVKVGATGDYKNLDSLVYDSVGNLMDPWCADDTELVVILGRELMADKYFPLIETHGGTPSENQALDMMISGKRVGGLQAAQVPGFPANSLAITRLDNLSIYYQEGTRRRQLVENAKRDRIEDYNSVNEAYVVEDYGYMCAVENITQV
ncbi:MAG: phage major capsid protein, P2 family [Gammaproteobacteria bacterium]|nr:phage major capsid protein, P2 family [Gammaproteobacteria bacterium]